MSANHRKAKEQPKIKSAETSKKHPAINLIDVYFQAGNWQVNREKLGSRNHLEVGFETDVLEQDTKHSYFLQKFELTAKPEKGGETAVLITCDIVVKCVSETDVAADFWKKYQQNTLPVISVPYFREYVFSLTGKMGIPPIHVPHWIR